MAITITVEDGTGVAGANSYVSLATVRQFAADRGVTLPASPAGDDQVSAWLIQAADWFQMKESEFIGVRSHTDPMQPLAWPRVADECACSPLVTLDGEVVPEAIKQSQMFLVMSLSRGVVILPEVVATDLVKKEKVGPLEVEYQDSGLALSGPSIAVVNGLLLPYTKLAPTSCGPVFRFERA